MENATFRVTIDKVAYTHKPDPIKDATAITRRLQQSGRASDNRWGWVRRGTLTEQDEWCDCGYEMTNHNILYSRLTFGRVSR